MNHHTKLNRSEDIVQTNIQWSFDLNHEYSQVHDLFTKHWLMNMYSECQTKLVTKEQFRTYYYKRNSPDLIIWAQTQQLWPWPCRYNSLSMHDTPPYGHMVTDHYTNFHCKGSVIQKISRLLSIEMFNLYCDIDLKHSNPVYLLDTWFCLWWSVIKLSFVAKELLV